MNDPLNVPLLTEEVGIYVCPSDTEINGTFFNMGGLTTVRSNYIGNGGAFENSFRPQLEQFNAVLGRTLDQSYNGVTLGQITDGPSNTMFSAEVLANAQDVVDSATGAVGNFT